MKDIVHEAGVSLGTVSNVINHKSSVSPENREKVLKAAQKLNYRVNTAARTLKTNISKSIGLIIPDITNPYYPELARGAEDYATKNNFTLFLCNSDRRVDKEREYAQSLISKNVDGLIIVKSKLGDDELSKIVNERGVILVDTDTPRSTHFSSVDVDDYDGISQAMNLLYDQGHRRIAYISGSMESRSSLMRRQAYIDFYAERGLLLDMDYIRQGTFDWYSGYASMNELFRMAAPPTAIVTANDLMAIGAMKAIRERRKSIPADISIIGYDDIDMASLCYPALTSVRQPKYEIGRICAEKLIERITHPSEGPSYVKLHAQLICRDSVGKCNE